MEKVKENANKDSLENFSQLQLLEGKAKYSTANIQKQKPQKTQKDKINKTLQIKVRSNIYKKVENLKGLIDSAKSLWK
jgi:hypothetical protein